MKNWKNCQTIELKTCGFFFSTATTEEFYLVHITDNHKIPRRFKHCDFAINKERMAMVIKHGGISIKVHFMENHAKKSKRYKYLEVGSAFIFPNIIFPKLIR